MSAFLYAYALMAMAPFHAPVTLNVDLASGTTVSGEITIKVTVIAQNPVTQVEFYVGSDLRDNATSTPYLFKFDSLPESDGDLKLRFKAYTTEGETGEKSVIVHVDNGLSKGADYHVQEGLSFLTNSDWKSAVTQGRIALKIDPKSNSGRIVLTRAYLGQRAFDKAQKYAEDAVSQDANNVQALNLLAAVNIELALGVVAKEGSDRKEVLASEREALTNAVGSRRKVLDNAVAAMAPPTDEASAVKFADVAIQAGRYGLVEQTLQPLIDGGTRNPELYKRLAYVMLRLSRSKDAITLLRRGEFLNSQDPEMNSILAVAYAEGDDVEDSDAALAKAKQTSVTAPGPKTAAAYIALKFARATTGVKSSFPLNYDDASGTDSEQKTRARAALAAALTGLLDDLGDRTETNYFAQSLENKLEDYQKADQYFESAILAEPANSDAFIEQGNRSIALSYRGKLDSDALQQQYDAAETMFRAALAAAPSSAAALTGLAVVNAIEGNADKAVEWAKAAVGADKNYAAGHAVLCSAYNILAKTQRSQADVLRKANQNIGPDAATRQATEIKARTLETSAVKLEVLAQISAKTAASLDPRISGYDMTGPAASWRYYYSGGRSPVITPPMS
jgi:tetratricopeptide (TPR) repeat protein